MSPASGSSKSLRERALRTLSERSGLDDLEIVRVQEDVVPSTGERLTRFSAAPKGAPNQVVRAIVLGDDGTLVDAVAVGRREGAKLFTDKAAAVGPDALAPATVTVSPATNDLRLGECDTFSEVVTVTIPESGAGGKADVYFCADTTGSMESILGSVQAGAASILAALSGSGFDLQYGVGNYKDFPTDPYCFMNQQPVTPNAPDVQNAINAWSASGGSDGPEGQLFALDQLAEGPGGAIGWRADAKRIIVWFGDAPGHDPVCQAISGLSYDITEASVTAKLVAEDITVLAISTVTGYPAGLDDDPAATSIDYTATCGAPGGVAGQATRIAAATGGAHVAGIDATTIVSTIIDLVKAAISATGNVSLVPAGAIGPFVVSISPAGGYGPLAGDVEHVLLFDVSFAGGAVECTAKDQVFTGTLDVVADGAVVGHKTVKITVPACRYGYSVKVVCGVQDDCGCECVPVRPGTYATEVNIFNPGCGDALVESRLLPLVNMGAAAGRWPRHVGVLARISSPLPSERATMIDCCQITASLLGAAPSSPTPVTIGILEIVSDKPLDITAVYTVSSPGSGHVSVEVERIKGALK